MVDISDALDRRRQVCELDIIFNFHKVKTMSSAPARRVGINSVGCCLVAGVLHSGRALHRGLPAGIEQEGDLAHLHAAGGLHGRVQGRGLLAPSHRHALVALIRISLRGRLRASTARRNCTSCTRLQLPHMHVIVLFLSLVGA
jgi:hypothetical protein